MDYLGIYSEICMIFLNANVIEAIVSGGLGLSSTKIGAKERGLGEPRNSKIMPTKIAGLPEVDYQS